MDDGCLDGADETDRCCGDAGDVDDADEQVFFDGAVGAPGDCPREHDLGEVVGEQRDPVDACRS